MTAIEFTEDFATKKKGEVWSCDSMLACSLIKKGVAKKTTEVEEEKPKRKRRTRAEIEADKQSE